jgi:hypothetical protein
MKPTDKMDAIGLLALYEIALQMIEKIVQLDDSIELGLYATFFFARTLGLAAVVILKLYRSSLLMDVSKERGERAYFAAIRLFKRRASDSPDLDAKLATILTELWSSPAIFRDESGNIDSLKVRVRTRLVRYKSPN